jgi:hypothetical protein
MNKQELIDEAVKQFKGVWPARNTCNVYMSYRPEVKNTTHYPFYLFDYEPNNVDFWHIEEFQKRARELGWVNGYKYGVEYETNGKKPDLPDDLLVDIKCETGANKWQGNENLKVSGVLWVGDEDMVPASHFKIVDDRFKPVEQYEPLKIPSTFEGSGQAGGMGAPASIDWYDYTQQKAVALPPVGAKVEVFLQWSGKWSGWVLVIGHDNDGIVWRNGSDSRSYIHTPRDEIRPLDHATRAKDLERERVVDAVFAEYKYHTHLSVYDVLEMMYDKGFLKLP